MNRKMMQGMFLFSFILASCQVVTNPIKTPTGNENLIPTPTALSYEQSQLRAQELHNYVETALKNEKFHLFQVEDIELYVSDLDKIDLNLVNYMYIPWLIKLQKYFNSHTILDEISQLPIESEKAKHRIFLFERLTRLGKDGAELDNIGETTYQDFTEGIDRRTGVINIAAYPEPDLEILNLYRAFAQTTCLASTPWSAEEQDALCNNFSLNVAAAGVGMSQEQTEQMLLLMGGTNLQGRSPDAKDIQLYFIPKTYGEFLLRK